MPWCPICKNEYKEGYTHCNDCNVDLVATKEQLPKTVMFGDEKDMQKIKEALEELGYKESYISYDDKNRCYELSVEPSVYEEATQALKKYVEDLTRKQLAEQLGADEEAMLDEEMLQEMAMEAASEQNRESSATGVYADKETKAEDYKSSAITLALVGTVGIILIILHAIGIIPITLPTSTKVMMYFVMGAMFIIFLICGALSWKSYKRLLVENDVEKAFIAEAETFLKTISTEQIEEGLDLSEVSEEMKYFKRTAVLKQILQEKYPETTEELIDFLADEYYDQQFGHEEN
jgi:hypothetical protein